MKGDELIGQIEQDLFREAVGAKFASDEDEDESLDGLSPEEIAFNNGFEGAQ